jgi:hypothetical protein
MSLPTLALDPDGNIRSVLVDAEGKLVTDLAPKPAETYSINQRSLRVDEDGNVEIA